MAEKERETREVAPYRRRGPLSVFEDMERMFERFMPEWPRAGFWGAPGFPDVDIFERDNQVVVKAELPGVKKEELSVDVTEAEVT
ncbi:MAG: Hsp20/alpha crystallin family protein, partial [Nitrospirota bacterium]